MRRLVMLVFLSLLATVPIGQGAPQGGSTATKRDLGEQPWTITKTYAAGERACVIAIGDHKSEVVNLQLNVFDAKGNLVAQDKGKNDLVGDFVSVIWYPPRTGEYRIEARNTSQNVNACYIAIK